MKYVLTREFLGILLITLLFQSVQAQTVSNDFWSNPNVIWKTNTGTIITGAFARKMHVQGNYTFEERPMSGSRVEVKMIPPSKKSPSNIEWDNPNLAVVDEFGKPIPIEVAKSLVRVISSKWDITKEQSGKITLTLPLSPSGTDVWSYTGSEIISNWIDEWRGKPLPKFELKNEYDELITNTLIEGKILVINFWNSRCQQCRTDMPQLNKVREIFGNEDVVFLAPNHEGLGTTQLFLQNEDFDFQVLSSAQSFLDLLELDFYPTNMIVDKEGVIIDINVGGGPRIGEEIGKKLSWLLSD